jgi:hypothetical protein
MKKVKFKVKVLLGLIAGMFIAVSIVNVKYADSYGSNSTKSTISLMNEEALADGEEQPNYSPGEWVTTYTRDDGKSLNPNSVESDGSDACIHTIYMRKTFNCSSTGTSNFTCGSKREETIYTPTDCNLIVSR